MCSPYDAEPPIPPIAGAAVASEDLELESKDGAHFAAFQALPDQAGGPAVAVLPDVRGLFRFYEELALRFAERGIEAVAIDYFGRTAGVAKRDAEFPFMDHIPRTDGQEIMDDVGAAVAVLRRDDASRPVFTMGFCFGGSNSWLQAAAGHGLSGAIGFYGHPSREGLNGAAPPIARVSEFECPILGLMGGADQGIPDEDIEKYNAALSEAGVEHQLHTYPGAPHSFFDRSYEEHAEAAADAWDRVLSFIEQRSAVAAG